MRQTRIDRLPLHHSEFVSSIATYSLPSLTCPTFFVLGVLHLEKISEQRNMWKFTAISELSMTLLCFSLLLSVFFVEVVLDNSVWLFLILSQTSHLFNFYKQVRTMSWVSHKLPRRGQLPRLILVSGCTGTGKSTFGMEVAINQGVLKCISTDTIRQVMRTDCVTFPSRHSRGSRAPSPLNTAPLPVSAR